MQRAKFITKEMDRGNTFHAASVTSTVTSLVATFSLFECPMVNIF